MINKQTSGCFSSKLQKLVLLETEINVILLLKQEEWAGSRTCPNTQSLMPESVRRPLKNMVSGMCPRRPSTRRKLHAAQFQVGNPAHLAAAREMGVAVVTLPDGRLQLLHTAAQARSAADAEEGLVFMHEMLELSKAQAHSDAAPLAVSFTAHGQRARLAAGPAHFGHVLRGTQRVTARIVLAEPMRACAPLVQPEHLAGRIAVIERGDCMFIDKVSHFFS